ncbi:diguanylate cyclase [Glaciecola sp. MH2013]|uniref:sensor domain-containing diguanylate cyclase n=1 Tax=Glaciecola sp. MH2013 TaxID=2785524 RepID=UPI00189F0B95|nr:diguanylate cyclase [Glaciecola sp. MH2013]MBF7074406.1 diguanylate cyclase [Glaciecola sp. MH2013]
MKLSVRISLVIFLLSLAISTVFASFNYYYQLKAATQQYQELTTQLATSAVNTAGIAAYLIDTELAQEVVDGLTANDLIASASITISSEELTISAGESKASRQKIEAVIRNPFIEDDIIGLLEVLPNVEFIELQASSASLENAYLLMGLSFIIAVAVGLYVRMKLTYPLKALADAVSLIDTDKPEAITPINTGYKHNDEIMALSQKTNSLISALKIQFLSERELREATEELQKRFRLLFEQATAGIGLLDSQGKISIANPAFQSLFGSDVEGLNFANLFESPKLVKKQISLLSASSGVSQVNIDLVLLNGTEKRYLHCLFSSIQDTRLNTRAESEQLVEVIVYDVTDRKKQEAKARYEADHDSLTGLLNRRSGAQKLNELLLKQHNEKQLFALMMIDLDKFKPINDTHGHDTGDLVLQNISRQVQELSHKYESVIARWGGDEFVVGLAFKDAEFLPIFTEELIEKISTEIEVNSELSVQVGASVGVIVLRAEQEASLDMLISKADDLMYETKKQKAKRYTIVDF